MSDKYLNFLFYHQHSNMQDTAPIKQWCLTKTLFQKPNFTECKLSQFDTVIYRNVCFLTKVHYNNKSFSENFCSNYHSLKYHSIFLFVRLLGLPILKFYINGKKHYQQYLNCLRQCDYKKHTINHVCDQ